MYIAIVDVEDMGLTIYNFFHSSSVPVDRVKGGGGGGGEREGDKRRKREKEWRNRREWRRVRGREDGGVMEGE